MVLPFYNYYYNWGMVGCVDIGSSIIIYRNWLLITYITVLLSTMQEQKQSQPTAQQPQTIQNSVSSPIDTVLKTYEQQTKSLIQQIRTIQNQEVELEVNEQLTEEKKQSNINEIKAITKQVLISENKVSIAKGMKQQIQGTKENTKQNVEQTSQTVKKQEEINNIKQTVDNEGQKLQITEEMIDSRYTELTQQLNDSSWTDATQSQAEDDEIWMVDQEIMKAMEEDSGQQDQDGNKQGGDQNNGQPEKQGKINLEQLEDQFVTGQQSDHHMLFGKHDKFCVSVNGINKQGLLFSGGGDDYLYMYKLPKQQVSKDKCLNPYHIVKHTETVNKIEVSFSKQYILTMTDHEILCTEIKTQETTKLKSKQSNKDMKQNSDAKQKKDSKTLEKKQGKDIKKQDLSSDSGEGSQEEEPICSDMACHHQGDVVAVASGYELEIFNIKGLKLYQTYYCERMIDMIQFTEGGKQIVLACDDNRLRLLTPKTSEIVTIGGVKQHQSEISVIKTKGDIILSGCIDGYIGITSIKKNALTTLIGTKQTEDLDGSINTLQFAGSYFMAGSASDNVDWYDLTKAKRLFQSPIEGSSSDIYWQGTDFQHLYNVSTIKGYIHLYDCRNPLKETARTRAGNTIHKLWAEGYNLAAACEDGHVRVYDVRKLL